MKEEKKKINFRELFKDKKKKAKIELLLYAFFLIGVIIFVRIMGTADNAEIEKEDVNSNFLSLIKDNYQYDIQVNINDEVISYVGKRLGNNMTINKINDNLSSYYFVNKDKYYVLEDGNYILTTRDDVYDLIDYRYFMVDNIMEYLKMANREDNIYKVKVADIILNSPSDDEITITLFEDSNSFTVDYTNLFRVYDSNIKKAVIDYKYSNIGRVISLDE